MTAWRHVVAAGVLAVSAGGAGGCQSRTAVPVAATQAGGAATTQGGAGGAAGTQAGDGPAGAVSAQDLHDILSDLAKAHEEKIKLSGWAGTPFLPVGPAFKPFFGHMQTQNKELFAELKDWAKGHHVDLTYHYSNDVDGKAQKMMEDRQEKVIRGDQQQDFERDILMQMADDYDWHLCRIKALLPNVRDAGLKDYLEKSVKMFEEGSGEIRGLLRRYKFE